MVAVLAGTAGIFAAGILVALRAGVWEPPPPIVTDLQAAKARAQSLVPTPGKHQLSEILREFRKVMQSASDADLDYLIREARVGRERVYDFVLLDELASRGDRSRIVTLLTGVDWYEPGWGDFWHADLEFRLATGFEGRRPLEGVDVLLDAAEAAPPGELRDHLLERIRWAVGPEGAGDAPNERLIEAARVWLEANRTSLVLNNKYPSFMDGGGPSFGTSFNSPNAVYMLQRREAEQPTDSPR